MGKSVITKKTFMILNSLKNHWVLLTNHNCDTNTWYLYDSLNGKNYFQSMSHIFKCFSELSPEVDYFILENRSIQLQKGSNDCGLFSLANLRSLCQEADPSLLHYEQKLMRNHFNVCIENKTFNSFKYRVTSRKNITHKSKIFNCKTNKFE